MLPTLNLSNILQKEGVSVSALTAGLPIRPSNWAVLLLRFNDQPSVPAPPPLSHYERLFTGKGAGTLNIPAFFSDMSHGQLDLSGSKVFDWMTINANLSDYVPNGPDENVPGGRFNRKGLVALGLQTARDNNVPLDNFDGIVYSFAGRVDLFGVTGGMAAVCDTESLWPSLLGQEMGHGYGLDHSRANGSLDDYMDPWDTMSTNVSGTFSTRDPDYNYVGPGLNAWNMRSRGWLDESRVWSPLFQGFDTQVVTLRPLHRRDLPGYLAANLGPFLVEYRVAERWDAGMWNGSGILVHSFDKLDNRSYLWGQPAVEFLSNPSAARPLKTGESFQIGQERTPPQITFETVYRCEVLSIDDSSHTATVRLTYRPGIVLPPLENPFQIGSGGDGAGLYLQGGKIYRIPPFGPIMQVMRQVIAHNEAVSIQDIGMRSLTQASALTGILRYASEALRALDPIRAPAPAVTGTHRNRGRPSAPP